MAMNGLVAPKVANELKAQYQNTDTDVFSLSSDPAVIVQAIRGGVSVDKLRQKVEANLHIRGKDIHAESVEPDMYAAIFAAGALGYALNIVFLTIEKSFVHWSGK